MDDKITQRIDELVENYFEQILDSLRKIIEIKSVKGKPCNGKPFGEGPAKALEKTLEIAKELGFETLNVDNYAGHVTFGNSGRLYGILGHLDVVPEGDLSKWETDPYKLTIKQGKIFGRGVIDNKGPSIGVLYALKIVSEIVRNPESTVRIIFGTNEENGSNCLKYYFKKQPYPDASVTPDGAFPLIFAEKGNATYEISTLLIGDYHTRLVEFEAGTAVNVVPETCKVVIETSKLKEIEYVVKGYKGKCKLEYEVFENKIKIKTTGKSAHGSTPELGLNAAMCMLEIIRNFDFGADNQVIETLYEKLGKDVNGKGLEIYGEDIISGKLTCNLGKINLENNKLTIHINLRYPIFFNIDMMTTQIKEAMKGFKVELKRHSKPLYVPKDNEFVQLLLRIYEGFTNDSSGPIAIGGGTYARTVPFGVAFGATFPGENPQMHQPNENWSLESLKRFVKIYSRVIYEWLVGCH